MFQGFEARGTEIRGRRDALKNLEKVVEDQALPYSNSLNNKKINFNDKLFGEARPQSESDQEDQSDPQSWTEDKNESPPGTDGKTNAQPESQPGTDDQDEDQPESQPGTDDQNKHQTESQPGTNGQSDDQPESQPVTDDQNEHQPESQPVTDDQNEHQPESQPGTDGQNEDEHEGQSENQSESQPGTNGQPGNQTESQSDTDNQPVTENEPAERRRYVNEINMNSDDVRMLNSRHSYLNGKRESSKTDCTQRTFSKMYIFTFFKYYRYVLLITSFLWVVTPNDVCPENALYVDVNRTIENP